MLREGWALALQLESCLFRKDFRPPAMVMSLYQLHLRGICDLHTWGNPRHPIRSLCSIKVQADAQRLCQQQNNPKSWENLYRLSILKKLQVVQNPRTEFCSEHPEGLKREGRVTAAPGELPPRLCCPRWDGRAAGTRDMENSATDSLVLWEIPQGGHSQGSQSTSREGHAQEFKVCAVPQPLPLGSHEPVAAARGRGAVGSQMGSEVKWQRSSFPAHMGTRSTTCT